MNRTWLVIALAAVLCSPLVAQEPIPCVDVVLIVDESSTMSQEYYDWLADTVVALESDYKAAGVGKTPAFPNRYILIGFGTTLHGTDQLAHFHGGWLDAASMATQIRDTLVDDGYYEDGYQAIKFAMNTLNFRKGAFRTVILVTDEDRDELDPVTKYDILKLLGAKDAVLNAVLYAKFAAPGFTTALGVTWDGTAYVPVGNDKYLAVPGGYFVSGSDDTRVDYVELCWKDRGSAWDICDIGMYGRAITKALVDVKVDELKPCVETNNAKMCATWMRPMGHCLYDGGQCCWFWFEYRLLGSLSWKKNVEWFPTFTDDWFSDEIKGLTPDTWYQARAWVKNSVMAAVGEAWLFRTLPEGSPDPVEWVNHW